MPDQLQLQLLFSHQAAHPAFHSLLAHMAVRHGGAGCISIKQCKQQAQPHVQQAGSEIIQQHSTAHTTRSAACLADICTDTQKVAAAAAAPPSRCTVSHTRPASHAHVHLRALPCQSKHLHTQGVPAHITGSAPPRWSASRLFFKAHHPPSE